MLARAAVGKQLLKMVFSPKKYLKEGRNHQTLVLTVRKTTVDLLTRILKGAADEVNTEIWSFLDSLQLSITSV